YVEHLACTWDFDLPRIRDCDLGLGPDLIVELTVYLSIWIDAGRLKLVPGDFANSDHQKTSECVGESTGDLGHVLRVRKSEFEVMAVALGVPSSTQCVDSGERPLTQCGRHRAGD